MKMIIFRDKNKLHYNLHDYLFMYEYEGAFPIVLIRPYIIIFVHPINEDEYLASYFWPDSREQPIQRTYTKSDLMRMVKYDIKFIVYTDTLQTTRQYFGVVNFIKNETPYKSIVYDNHYLTEKFWISGNTENDVIDVIGSYSYPQCLDKTNIRYYYHYEKVLGNQMWRFAPNKETFPQLRNLK